MHWQVVFTDEARKEFDQLPAREQSAMIHALDKLAAEGPALPYPHSSAVQGADGLRELRLRAGRSAWRGSGRSHVLWQPHATDPGRDTPLKCRCVPARSSG